MIRLVLLLCAGLYFGLLVLGEDHGQKRYGLMMADALSTPTPPPERTAAEVVFIPAQPVMPPVAVAAETPVVARAVPRADPPPAAAEAAPVASAPLPEPEIPGGALFTVASRQVNVRQGPGTNHAVIGNLSNGEQVLVVVEENPVAGWSHVRLEGDGIDGFVATRFLTRTAAPD